MCTFPYVQICVFLCTRTCVLCLRGGGEDKGEAKEQKGFGGRKVMGLWGSKNELKL